VVVTLALSALLTGAGLSDAGRAWATWTTAASGPGAGEAVVLAVPSPVTATCESTAAVRVDWTTSQAAPVVTSFLVERSSDVGVIWTPVGAEVPATSATTYSLTDPGLGTGIFVYRVTALRATSWTRTSATTASRTVTETACL